ncbi:MAG: hypothetical protein ACRCVT_13145 [Leadbetterella sp.]
MEDQSYNNSSSSSNLLKAGLVLALLLAGIFAYLYFQEKRSNSTQNLTLIESKSELVRTGSKLDSIKNQLDQKIAEIEALGGQVNELKELRIKLEKDKANLLNSKNVNFKEYESKIKDYEAQLALKDEEIAKLKEENVVLTNQNEVLSSENSGLKSSNEDLKTKKEVLEDSVYKTTVKNRELSEKVTLAAALRPMSYSVTAINSRGKQREGEAFKAKRVDKIKLTFKLAENPLTRKENKTIFLRLMDHQGNVISDMATGSGIMTFGGKETIYTTSETIMYSNTGQAVEMYYTRGTAYEKGTYNIELYADGFRIGQTSFVVK